MIHNLNTFVCCVSKKSLYNIFYSNFRRIEMLSNKIRKLRLNRGLNQAELANALGVSKQTISNWENNNIQPSIDMLLQLSKFFSVSTDCLLGLDDIKYVQVSNLSDEQLSHIQQIIDDILK